MQQNTLGNILKDGFDTCWNNLYIARKKHIEIDLGCKDCSYKKFCTYCAPKLKSEYGIPYKNRAACRSIKEFYQRMYEVDDINR
jgi:radical SAM protein with 4Fe4S-binding SPASM domain